MKKAGILALGALTLIAAGAAIGMLYAPASGKKTRRRLCRKVENMADAVETSLNDAKDSLDDAVTRLKESFVPG